MQRISTHIEKLLFFNDCVIIPDFGGFVLQIHPAVCLYSTHAFSPPYKDVVFNPTLNHNDGLLSESYMQMYGMNFNEAQVAVKLDVETLKRELNRNGVVSLGVIGGFHKYKETLIFEPAILTPAFNVTSYGLSPFYLPPVKFTTVEAQSNVVALKNDIYMEGEYEPSISLPSLNKMLSQMAGIAAAAIGLFLLISTPVKDVNLSAYTASFIPSEMVSGQRYIVQQQATDEVEEVVSGVIAPIIAEDTVAVVDVSTVIRSLSLPNQQSSVSAETLEKIQSLSIPNIESVTAKTYYVIVASFETETQLKKFLSNTDLSALKSMGVVKNNERIRVYADKMNNRKDAEAYMQFLRENEKYKDAWLFVGR